MARGSPLVLTALVAGLLAWAVPSSVAQAQVPHPFFCANRSLGGPQTYPFDSDGDGWYDTCSLRDTRRATVARQNALEEAFSDHTQYEPALAAACIALGTIDFGDHAEDLAVDSCNPPAAPPEYGDPLPTPPS